MNDKFQALLRSRKFWAALTGLMLVIVRAFAPGFPLEDEQIIAAVCLLAAYILGTGLEDGLRG